MDRDVKQKQRLMHSEITDTLRTGKVDLKTTIPALLTPERTLEILQKMKDVRLNLQRKARQELEEEGHEVSFFNPLLQEKLIKLDLDGKL